MQLFKDLIYRITTLVINFSGRIGCDLSRPWNSEFSKNFLNFHFRDTIRALVAIRISYNLVGVNMESIRLIFRQVSPVEHPDSRQE